MWNFLYLIKIQTYMMGENCQRCNRKMDYPWLTHCSDKCLFDIVKNSESISDTPVEDWDSNPWI